MPLTAGTRLGPYQIESAIGAGGMGEVYRAKDARLDRTVAIKVLPPHLADDPQFRDRFDREAKSISALNHPNICTLYDVGEAPPLDDAPGALSDSRRASPEPHASEDWHFTKVYRRDASGWRVISYHAWESPP